MIDKIKEKIDSNKKDTTVYEEYIKSFTECDKAKELFSEDEDFKKLSNSKKEEIKKEEDEYF